MMDFEMCNLYSVTDHLSLLPEHMVKTLFPLKYMMHQLIGNHVSMVQASHYIVVEGMKYFLILTDQISDLEKLFPMVYYQSVGQLPPVIYNSYYCNHVEY